MIILCILLFTYSILNLLFLDNISLIQNLTTLVFTHVILILIVFFRNNSFQNTFLWFQLMFFLLISFTPSLILLGFVELEDILNLRTNFYNNISETSFSLAVALSNFAITFLTFLFLLFPYKDLSKSYIASYPRLFNFSLPFLLLLLPLMFYMTYMQVMFIKETGYAFMYTGEVPKFLPFQSVIVNLSTIFFYLVLTSKPREKYFIIIGLIFLALKFLESIAGARGAFILPLFAFIWLWSLLYNKGKIPILNSSFVMASLLLFSIFITSSRDEISESFESTEISFVSSLLGIGKGLETFAIFIDNKNLVQQNEVFLFQPVIFPIKYISGQDIVGQNETTIQNRKNLNHQLSYALNPGAYLSGAGLGSSFLAESFQYGIFFYIIFLMLFFFFYKFIFDNIISNIFLRMLSIPLFTHFIFTPRDHAFVNFFLFFKYLPLLVFIYIFFYGIRLSKNSFFKSN